MKHLADFGLPGLEPFINIEIEIEKLLNSRYITKVLDKKYRDMENAYCTLPLFGDKCMRAFRYWEFSEIRGRMR